MIPPSLPLFIDSDNALGAPFGDVDDAFAISALLKARVPVLGIGSVFGNTFEPWAHENNLALAELCGFRGRVYRGAPTWWAKDSEAARALAAVTTPLRVLAIGPLTNIALALKINAALAGHIQELVIVGTNLVRLPALRFFDFNQFKDPWSTRRVFDSSVSLTCVPCNVARQLRTTAKDVARIQGALGRFLSHGARRWFLRARLLKWVESVPVWDLTAAMYVLYPDLFEVRHTRATIGRWGEAHFGAEAKRPVRLIVDFNPQEVWNAFLKVVEGDETRNVI